MSYKKRSEWKDDFVDTGKTLTEEDLLNTEPPHKKESSQQKTEEPKAQNPHKVEVNQSNNESLKNDSLKEDKSKEYLEMAQRVQAEFDNFRRRNLDIASTSRKDGIAFAVQELLPVLDTINSAKRQLMDENLAKSLDLIYKQTLDCFSKLGVTKIEAKGKPFDPVYHNAIMTEAVDGVEPDIVLDEFQEGFMIDGRVIRHSVVKVST